MITRSATWVHAIPFAPAQAPARLITAAPEPALTIGSLTIGAVAGIIVAGIAYREHVRIIINDEQITRVRKGKAQEFPSTFVESALLDDKQFVLLGHSKKELAGENADLYLDTIVGAVHEHGYRWRDAEPYRARFRRRLPGTAHLPVGADVLLPVRHRPVSKTGDCAQTRQLRHELARLGIVVRDDHKRQYWRLSGATPVKRPFQRSCQPQATRAELR